MTPKTIAALIVLGCLGLAACGSGSDAPPPGPEPAPETNPRTVVGTQTIGPEGGEQDFGNLRLKAFNTAVVDTVEVEVATLADAPAQLPDGFRPAGEVFDIEVKRGADAIEIPFVLTFSGLRAEPDELFSVLHFDEDRGAYEPTTVLEMDVAGGRVVVESRAFSVFIPTASKMQEIPTGFQVPTYRPDRHGWSIQNFGRYFSPNGNCLGMSAFSVWAHTALDIELFSEVQGVNAEVLATRAHLANSKTWTLKQFNSDVNIKDQSIDPHVRARIIKYHLFRFQKPVVFFMQKDDSPAGHAGVIYGYDELGFDVYDPNYPGVSRRLDYDEFLGWGTYEALVGYNKFAMIAKPSLGRNTDFGVLWAAYLNDFNGPGIVMTNPTFTDPISVRNVVLEGQVTEGNWNKVSIWVKTKRYDAPITNGRFSIQVPLTSGDNEITVLAGSNLSNRNSYTGSATIRRTLTCSAQARPYVVTLEWNLGNSDVDLYNQNPAPEGEWVWYSHRSSARGDELDFDNTQGFGPENYLVGQVLAGTYKVRVHYYRSPSNGTTSAVCTVSILLDEGGPTQRLASRSFTLSQADSSNAAPEATGPDWADVAEVDVLNGTINWLVAGP